MRKSQFLLITIGVILSAASVRADEPAEPAPGRVSWAEELVQSAQPGPASRLRIADSRLLAGQEPVALVVADFTYLDPHGQEQKARAKLYLPGALRTDKAKVPLYFAAGYEATDPVALTYVKRGWLVVSPSHVEPNPMVRTANPDTALLHIARSLPFVDDTKVMIGGGSAGGYITLMLAAETFPLAGAAPDVPPVNWGYNGAYFFNQYDKVLAARDAKQGRDVPFLAAVTPMLEGAKQLYGKEYGDLIWFRHSPLSHLATITCPVSALWSTADVLVPMQQIGDRWLRPFEPKEFPEGFTMDPSRLTATREGRLRLTDVLADEEYEVFTLLVPDTVTSEKPIELPVSASKRWSVTILDEGPPGSKVGHFKRNLAVSREEFFRRILGGGVAASQLTAPKLERMMDRYAGIEWLPTKLKHLDYAEIERADVLRGLKTYIMADPENASTFARLYQELLPAKRVLEPQVMRQLRERPQSPISVEAQPLAANLRRLQQALDYLGAPLPQQTAARLQEAARKEDAQLLQEVIESQVAFVVEINPESRVRVARGRAPARLQQAGFTPFVVKVVNYGAVTQPLRILSPAGGAVYGGEYRASLERQQQLNLQSGQQQAVAGRFLSLEMFGSAPMTARLSGLAVEYCVGLIYSTEAGRREATIGFDVDQGTQDLGFRGETPVLFDIAPAIPVKLRVLDDDGRPTTARFLFRDRAGHVYPPQPKRLYPDFFFQPHIYRADGETVLLPRGEFAVDVSRGPEYRVLGRSLTVPASTDAPAEFSVRLERWINPRQFGFYSGDHHIHAAGCAHYSSPSEGILPRDALRQVKGEGLNVGCILTWGFCYDFQRQFYSPAADNVSEPFTVVKYDIEISGFGSAALGHVCLLNLRDHVYPGTDGMQGWPTWATPALRWAKEQGGYTGYPHSGSSMQVEPAPASARLMADFDADHDQALSSEEAGRALLPEPFLRIDADADGVITEAELARSHERIAEQLPNLGVPEAPLEMIAATAHGVCDFVSTMDTPRVREWNAWYHLMNCGFPIKVAGETDFPCMSGTRVGQGRTYVQLGDVEKVDFPRWCEGLARGRSYASDGYAHALRFAVEGTVAGQEIRLDGPKKLAVSAGVAFASQTPLEVAYGLATPAGGKVWSGDTVTIHAAKPAASTQERTVELVVNGQVVASTKVPADDQIHEVSFAAPIERSSWVALRQFPQLHTNPVTVLVADKPIRASRSSARWCAALVEQLWRARERNIAPAERDAAHQSFREAIETYHRIAAESPEGT